MHQAGLPHAAQFSSQAAGTPMPECPAQAVAVPVARLPGTGDLGQPAGALSATPAERKPSPGPALQMRPALLPGGSNVVSRPSAPPAPAGGGAPASASTSRPGSGAPGASRPELRFAASRLTQSGNLRKVEIGREEVLRSDGRQEVRWFLSDPHGTSWLAVAGLKGDQAGAAAPGQAFMAQGSFVTRTPFSSMTEAGVEAFLQQILRATGRPLSQQQTADAAAAPGSMHAARASPRPASGSQATAPAVPAGVGPAPAADQVIKPAPIAPEKVPVQVLADINLEKHLQQEREAVELAARDAVIVELQSRAADEAARRATAVKAALQWVQAPVDPSELEYVEIQLQNIKGLLAEYEKQVHPPEPEPQPEPEQAQGAGQGEEGEAAQAEGRQAGGKGGKSVPKKGKRRAKPRPRTKEARSRAKQSMAAAAAAAAAGVAASGVAGLSEAAGVEAASAASPTAAAAEGKTAAEQAASEDARAAKAGAHMAQASPSVQARGLVDYPSDSDASVDTVRSKGRPKSIPAVEPRRRAPLRTASAAGKTGGKGTPAGGTSAQPVDVTPPEPAAPQPKLESEAGPKQEPCVDDDQVAPSAEGDNERGAAHQQGRQREAAAARLAPAPGKASKLHGMVLSDLLDALRELASTHMSLRIMMATNVMASVQPLRDHEDWAIRTMACNCSDQWRRSMAAHLGTLAQPRFVQDPLREADRLLASRAAQLDAAIPPPGARVGSAVPGERKGKGGSVPRTDVVAALQAAAARTPPPPSQAGMPSAPAAATGLAAAAAAPAGAKPNQAVASGPVASVSASAAVLAPGDTMAKPLPHAPKVNEVDTAAAAQEVKAAPAAPGAMLSRLVQQPEAAQPITEARQPDREQPVAAANGATQLAVAAPGPRTLAPPTGGDVPGMAGLTPVAALPDPQATQASGMGSVQQQRPEQLAEPSPAQGTAAAAAAAAAYPSQQRPQSPLSNAVGSVMGSAVGQQHRQTAGPQAAGPSPVVSRSPASRPGSAQQKGLASLPAAMPTRPSMPAQQVPASMITVPAPLLQTTGFGQAGVTKQQLWAQQGQFGQRTCAPLLAQHFRPVPLQQPRPGLAGAAAGQPQWAGVSPTSQAGRPQAGATSRPGSAGALGQPVARAVVPSPRVIVGKAPSPISPASPPPMQLPAAAPAALAPVLAASNPPMPVSMPPAATSPQAGAAGPPPPQATAAQAEASKGASKAGRAALPAPATAAAGQAPLREAGARAAKASRDQAGILAALQSRSQENAEEPSQAAADEREVSEESSDEGAEDGSVDEGRAQDDGSDPGASELSDLESAEGERRSPAHMPADGIRRSNRSRHQPSWTQLNESGTDPSSSGPPARVAGLRSRRHPQALEDQATDSQVEAAGAGTPSRLRTTSARAEDSAGGTDEEGPSGQEQSPSLEGDEADGDEAEQGGSELRRGTRARRKTAAVLEAEAAQRKTAQARRRRPPRARATPRARGRTGSGDESEGEQQVRELDVQSQSSEASGAEDGPGSAVATPGSDPGSPTGASEAEGLAGSDGDSEAEGATSGEDAVQEPAEDTAAVVPAEAAKLKFRQPVAASRGGAAALRLAKPAAGQKRQHGGTKAGDDARGAAKQQRGPAAAATAAAAAAAAAAADDGGDTDPAPSLKVHRRPRTGGRKRKSMDGAARLRAAPDESAAAAEPAHKRKRKSAPAAKAAAADKDEEPELSSRKAAGKRAGAAVVSSAAKKGKAAQPRSATPAGSDAEATIPDEESWDKALLRKLQTAPPGADAADMAPAAQALCYLEWFGKPLKNSRFIQISPLVTSANKGVFLRLRRDPDWRDNSRGAKKVTTASKHVQDAAAKIRQGRPFHANNKSKQALLNAFDRLIAMVAELVSNE